MALFYRFDDVWIYKSISLVFASVHTFPISITNWKIRDFRDFALVLKRDPKLHINYHLRGV